MCVCALTAVVLVAVVSAVVPAVTLQRLVNAQVVATLEATRTSCPTRQGDIVRKTGLLEERREFHWGEVKVKASVTVGGDEGFVLGVETLVNVGRVRLKGDGHRVASTGDHYLLWFTSTQSTILASVSMRASASPPVAQLLL